MRTFIEKLCDRYKVSETDVQSLLNCMEEVHFKKKDLIVREGTKNCNLYFIKTGIWRAYYHKDGVDTLSIYCPVKGRFRIGIFINRSDGYLPTNFCFIDGGFFFQGNDRSGKKRRVLLFFHA